MPSPGVLFHTLRHLRFRQVRHQALRHLWRRRPAASLPLRWIRLSPAFPQSKNTGRTFVEGRDGFRFNNESRRFDGDWNDASARKLWLYNLHYMAWIFDLESGREEWIERWIRENPPAAGNGWEPYPVSLRLVNWCKHYTLAGSTPSAAVLASLGQQTAWLLANLEFHLDGNHLLENLLALQYAALFLDTGDARAARAETRIARALERELQGQFLGDGGHCELSPMYHAILLERMLDLLNVWPDRDPLRPLKGMLEAKTRAALAWLEVMSVDGKFALFNDSCYDAAPEAGLLLEYGKRILDFRPPPVAPLAALPASGYFRAEAGPLTLIFDGGRLGPDHQMGHAQGDMLSFCLWLGSRPVVVHPGNFEYVPGPMRDYCRSTASHNTLVMDGGEQADWWAAHRVGWRGRPRNADATVDPATGEIRIHGSHDAFSRLPGRPIHSREVTLAPFSLAILDRLSISPRRGCRIYYHFHPDCILTRENDKIRIRGPAGCLVMEADHPMRIEDSWYCPEFGLRYRNRAVVVECGNWEARSHLTLQNG